MTAGFKPTVRRGTHSLFFPPGRTPKNKSPLRTTRGPLYETDESTDWIFDTREINPPLDRTLSRKCITLFYIFTRNFTFGKFKNAHGNRQVSRVVFGPLRWIFNKFWIAIRISKADGGLTVAESNILILRVRIVYFPK